MDSKTVTMALTFVLLLVPWVALGFPKVKARLPAAGRFSPLASLLLIALYAPYSAGTGGGSWRGLLVLGIYLFLSALCAIPVSSPRSVFVLTTALVLWLPFDFDWGDHRIMADIWRWPGDDLGYALSALTASVAGLFYFVWSRPIDLKYEWRLDRKTLRLLLLLLAVLTGAMIPLGQAVGFLAVGLRDTRHPWEPLLGGLLIFIFTAIPEEIVFRGLIQNWLQARLGAESWAALVVGAVVFGSAHLNNPAGVYRPPNFVYMGMATLAGLAYGIAWRRGGIAESALLHTAVDWIWRFLLAGEPRT